MELICYHICSCNISFHFIGIAITLSKTNAIYIINIQQNLNLFAIHEAQSFRVYTNDFLAKITTATGKVEKFYLYNCHVDDMRLHLQ